MKTKKQTEAHTRRDEKREGIAYYVRFAEVNRWKTLLFAGVVRRRSVVLVDFFRLVGKAVEGRTVVLLLVDGFWWWYDEGGLRGFFGDDVDAVDSRSLLELNRRRVRGDGRLSCRCSGSPAVEIW